MPRKLSGGSATPVFAITSADLVSNGGQYKLESKTALPVWGMVSGERPTIGGVAQAVYPVSEDDVASGDYKLAGGAAFPVIDAATYVTGRKRNSSKVATPIYVVGGQALIPTIPTFNLDAALTTFTARMAKRAGLKAFAATPIVQGDANNASALTDDVLSLGRGSPVSGNFYDNFDGEQGTANFWWTPEYAYDALAGAGDHYLWYVSSDYYFAYEYDNDRYLLMVGGQSMTVGSNIAAGATYHLVTSWDCNNDFDGTNYARVSINDAHTYGVTVQPTAAAPSATIYIGTNGTTNAASGVIEGFCISRLVWYDGTRGINVGAGDVINLAFAAGAGKDPASLVGSWDTVLFIPTNSTEEELSSGTGEAWSHPHSSAEAVLTDTFCQTTWGSSAWGNEGTPSVGPADLATAEKIFNWGYKWTCDAANEGITQTIAGLTPGQDYVIRVIAHCTSANDIRVRIWDETNGAQIGADFDFGASSSRTAPGVALFCFELPTNARNGVGADCVSISVKVMGVANTQVVYCHQIELQENLIDNPSLETWSGASPDIPDGWTNVDLDAGDLENSAGSAAIIHSGVDAAEFNAGATTAEGVFSNSFASVSIADFFCYGGWVYGSGAASAHLESTSDRLVEHATSSTGIDKTSVAAAWAHVVSVGRAIHATLQSRLNGGGVETYVDDLYAFELDAVSLTVTPANEANSAEGSGLRVDGRDTLTQPIPAGSLGESSGKIRFNWTPRHNAADAIAFGNVLPNIAMLWDASTNYIRVRWSAANTIQLTVFIGGANSAVWDATGLIVAGTAYLIEIEYNATQCTLTVDGTLRITVTPGAGVNFVAGIPDTAYWGSSNVGVNQVDAVFSAP